MMLAASKELIVIGLISITSSSLLLWLLFFGIIGTSLYTFILVYLIFSPTKFFKPSPEEWFRKASELVNRKASYRVSKVLFGFNMFGSKSPIKTKVRRSIFCWKYRESFGPDGMSEFESHCKNFTSDILKLAKGFKKYKFDYENLTSDQKWTLYRLLRNIDILLALDERLKVWEKTFLSRVLNGRNYRILNESDRKKLIKFRKQIIEVKR